MPTFAAVDIGSNSVRLKIARLTRHRLSEIHEDREVTRLGESVFRNGFLSPEAIANHGEGVAPVSSRGAECGRRFRARRRHQRLARRAQFQGLSGVGSFDHGMECRNHFRTGRSAAHSSGPGFHPAREFLARADDGSGRRQLRTHHFSEGPHPRYRQPAAWRGASDQ